YSAENRIEGTDLSLGLVWSADKIEECKAVSKLLHKSEKNMIGYYNDDFFANIFKIQNMKSIKYIKMH
ncbi:Hypothetical predicted protein, partial [Mytilus galloprovincialis]